MTGASAHDLVDLRAAVEQLDEWYLHELAPIDAARMRATAAYFNAVNDRDLDRAVSTLASDVVSTTHRPVSWGTLERDGVAVGLASITEFDGDIVYSIERVEFNGPSEMTFASRLQFTDQSGNVMVDRWVTTKRCASGQRSDRCDGARSTRSHRRCTGDLRPPCCGDRHGSNGQLGGDRRRTGQRPRSFRRAGRVPAPPRRRLLGDAARRIDRHPRRRHERCRGSERSRFRRYPTEGRRRRRRSRHDAGRDR